MAMKPITSHCVQLFVLVKGRLAQGNRVDCKSPADACRIAEERVRCGRAVGAAAFTRTIADPDYDDGSEPITLAAFGRVPSGVTEHLPY